MKKPARNLTTIKDVAAFAAVSPAAVSHVINGNDQHVSEKTRLRIWQAIEQLKYRPNAIARSMVKRTTATIGVVIMELTNPLFAPVIGGIEEVLQPANYNMLLASAENLEAEMRAVETLKSKQVDGFIFLSLSIKYPSEHILQLKHEGKALVVINRYLDEPAINRVQVDDFGAAQAVTRHLISLGHTRIGIIAGPLENEPPRRSALERFGGWQAALREADLEIHPEWILLGDYGYKSGYDAVTTLLSHPISQQPTALFVANESMAMGALKASHEAGRSVPQNLALVTVGDPPFAAYTVPALTTTTLPFVKAGTVAAQILLGNLKTQEEVRPQSVTLGCTIKIRESCGASLSRD